MRSPIGPSRVLSKYLLLTKHIPQLLGAMVCESPIGPSRVLSRYSLLTKHIPQLLGAMVCESPIKPSRVLSRYLLLTKHIPQLLGAMDASHLSNLWRFAPARTEHSQPRLRLGLSAGVLPAVCLFCGGRLLATYYLLLTTYYRLGTRQLAIQHCVALLSPSGESLAMATNIRLAAQQLARRGERRAR